MTIVPPRNGGSALTGNIGRNIANACDVSARETIRAAAAHFMSAANSRIKSGGKQFLRDLGN
jgi:hypothetical protein